MNNEQHELFRSAILRGLKAASSLGMSLSTVDTFVRTSGFPKVSNDEVESALQYLSDKGLITDVKKVHSAAVRHWRLTAEGVDYLEARGM